jgi:hypothetical protein
MFADEIRISVGNYHGILGTDLKIHCSFQFFIYSLFNNAVSSSGYIMSNDRMNNELEMMWKEAVMYNFKYCPDMCPKGLMSHLSFKLSTSQIQARSVTT